MACGILTHQPGIKPMSLASAAWNLNHWTSREVPSLTLFSEQTLWLVSSWKYLFFIVSLLFWLKGCSVPEYV